jgi:hypothetical protein
MNAADAARRIASEASSATAWNDDAVEVAALVAVAKYFRRFAELLEAEEG